MIQHLERPKSNFKAAISLMIIADLMCASQAVFVKLASPYFTPNTLVFVRFLVNLLMLYGWVLFTDGGKGFGMLYKTKVWKKHMVRSISGAGAVYCLYFGLAHMPIGPATLLFFTFPIFIPLVARIWLRVALIHRLWWGLGISFLGIIFVLRPGAGLFNPVAFIPLLGAILGSISTVSIRVLHYTETTKTIMAYYFTFGLVVSGLILGVFQEMEMKNFTFYSVWMAIFVGASAAIFQTLFTFATKFAPARFLSPFIYGIFIFSSIGEYLIFGKALNTGTIIGFLLILLGTILMVFLYPKDDRVFVPKNKK